LGGNGSIVVRLDLLQGWGSVEGAGCRNELADLHPISAAEMASCGPTAPTVDELEGGEGVSEHGGWGRTEGEGKAEGDELAVGAAPGFRDCHKAGGLGVSIKCSSTARGEDGAISVHSARERELIDGAELHQTGIAGFRVDGRPVGGTLKRVLR
jgi:hypothetical protein